MMNFAGDFLITRSVYARHAFRCADYGLQLPLLIVKDLKIDLAL
jgi:hypothetical protein